VAIDAYAIHVTPADDRGRVSAFMQLGMFGGRWIFGAGALAAITHIPQAVVIPSLVGVIWSIAAVLLVCKEPAPEQATKDRPAKHAGSFITGLRNAFARPTTWLGLGLAVIGGAAFEAVGLVVGPFLVDRG